MSTHLDAALFAEALHSERGLTLPISAEGFVRKTDDKVVIEFSPSSALYLAWIKIPLKMIDKVQLLGKRKCFDHLHDDVILHFKRPDGLEAAVFAELFHYQANAQSTAMPCVTEPVPEAAVGAMRVADAADRGQWCCRVYILSMGGSWIEAHKQTHGFPEAAAQDCSRTVQHLQFQGFKCKPVVSNTAC